MKLSDARRTEKKLRRAFELANDCLFELKTRLEGPEAQAWIHEIGGVMGAIHGSLYKIYEEHPSLMPRELRPDTDREAG